MTLKTTSIVNRKLTSTPKPIDKEFDIKEVNNLSHLRVETLDIKLIIELRSMKYKVGPEGMVIWNSKEGYLVEINNTKILDQWIEFLKLKKIILYNLVLPQEVEIANFKKIFYIEKDTITSFDNSDVLVYKTNNTRLDSLNESISKLTLREGAILVCH